jgi:hypothetical protein
MSFYALLMGIDMDKLEAERFGLQPDQARTMLEAQEQPRQIAIKRQPKRVLPDSKTETVQKQKPKAKVKRRSTVLHLTEAQERAFANYVEGLK